jgi:prephenate dehydrogenase
MTKTRLGLFGFGAFGRLLSAHLSPYFDILAYDPRGTVSAAPGLQASSREEAAACDIVVIATPVANMEETARYLAGRVRPGALVLDVGSVKVLPSQILREHLPDHVDVVGTHPLFGPQSAAKGVEGLNLVLCNIRGNRTPRVAAFLRKALALNVIVTTPEEHDRQAAVVQGLTHLIAKVLVEMEPLPSQMTTKSFELIMQAVEMVRYDAPEVYEAIERLNPYSVSVRERFFRLASKHSYSPRDIQ